MTNGIDFYQFVADLSEHFEERKDELTQVLETLSRQIFRGDHMMVSFTASRDGLDGLEELGLSRYLEVLDIYYGLN